MIRTFRDALRYALDTQGRKLSDVTRAAGVSYDQYKGFLQGKSRSTNVDDAVKVAAVFGVTLEQFLSGDLASIGDEVPIVGTVGAGAQVPVFEAYEPGDGPKVSRPPGLPNGQIVAVEIEGDSMEPVYFSGDFLFYRRDTHDGIPAEAEGRTCVCEDTDGNGWVKQVKRGDEPGLYHLISLNPRAESMWNVKLRWAAPVRLHWPAELARKL